MSTVDEADTPYLFAGTTEIHLLWADDLEFTELDAHIEREFFWLERPARCLNWGIVRVLAEYTLMGLGHRSHHALPAIRKVMSGIRKIIPWPAAEHLPWRMHYADVCQEISSLPDPTIYERAALARAAWSLEHNVENWIIYNFPLSRDFKTSGDEFSWLDE